MKNSPCFVFERTRQVVIGGGLTLLERLHSKRRSTVTLFLISRVLQSISGIDFSLCIFELCNKLAGDTLVFPGYDLLQCVICVFFYFNMFRDSL